MSGEGNNRLWNVEVLRKRIEQLQSETAELRAEVARLAKGREVERQVTGKLRAQIQSAHHREKSLKALYTGVIKNTPGREASDAEEIAFATGREAPPKTGERVDPLLLERLPPADKEGGEGWLDSGKALPPLPPHPGWGNYESAGEALVAIGISLLSLGRDDQARIIDLVGRQQLRNRTFAPVFLTDDDDFRLLREEHYIFEYLPPWPGPDLIPSRREWEDFLLRRITLIRRKWGLRRFVYFSAQALQEAEGRTVETLRMALDGEVS